MPKLYYKYWQKQELLNPYSKHSKFYTSNNLNTYKRQPPSHLSLKNLSNLSDQIGMSIFTHTTIHQNTPRPLWPHNSYTESATYSLSYELFMLFQSVKLSTHFERDADFTISINTLWLHSGIFYRIFLSPIFLYNSANPEK